MRILKWLLRCCELEVIGRTSWHTNPHTVNMMKAFLFGMVK